MSTGLVLALKLDHLRKLEENSSTLKPPPPPPRYLNWGAKITATSSTTTTKTAWTWILTDFGNGIHCCLQGKTAKKRFWMAGRKVPGITLCIHPDQSWQRRCRWMRKRSLCAEVGEGGERIINIRYPGESDAKKMVVLQRFWGKCEEVLTVKS